MSHLLRPQKTRDDDKCRHGVPYSEYCDDCAKEAANPTDVNVPDGDTEDEDED
jgi:hypothetical protein